MDTLEFIKNFRRLCYSHDCCVDCPCFKDNNENCNLLSVNLTEKEIVKYIEIVEKWIKEHPIEIDWSKVPKDTPVYVRQNETDGKVRRYFSKYYPNYEKPFQCYVDGQTSWTSNDAITYWVHCELARVQALKKNAHR